LKTDPQRRALLALAATLALGLYTPPSFAAIEDIQDAINKAGRMRMLSQRMAKLYCQLGMGILPDRSRKLLDASMRLYQDHLLELKAFSPSADIKHSYEELELVWRRYEQLLKTAPSQGEARKIATVNEEALSLAHLATTQLELHAGTNVGRLINISGRQRMLSQRLAKFYMFQQWGVATPEMAKQAQLAQREFVSAMQALQRASENTDKIKGELGAAANQWIFFEQALQQTGDLSLANDVATTSERILEVMDRVTGLYAKLGQEAAKGAAPIRKR
jgi:nitrate/nitrite-specific signal transduction histidine kinase